MMTTTVDSYPDFGRSIDRCCRSFHFFENHSCCVWNDDSFEIRDQETSEADESTRRDDDLSTKVLMMSR